MLTNQDFTKLIMINDTINFLGILTRITSDLYYSNDYIIDTKIFDNLMNNLNKLYKLLISDYKKTILKYINEDRFEKLKEHYKNIYTLDFLIEFIKEL